MPAIRAGMTDAADGQKLEIKPHPDAKKGHSQ
jgi:hypothetical protein